MEIKTSTVSKVVPTNKPYESQYGTLYGFYITFANGDNGKYNSKSPDQTKFVVGQTASYEYIGKDYNGKTFYTVKPANPDYAPAPSNDVAPVRNSHAPAVASGAMTKDELIVRQTALKASADLGGDPATVLQNAERFVAWVMGKETQTSTHQDHFSGREKVQVTEQVADDGLPF